MEEIIKPLQEECPDLENPALHLGNQRKHYVLVIHGTFAGPKEGLNGAPPDFSHKWWAPEGSTRSGLPFCSKLRAALDASCERGLGQIPGEAVWGDIADAAVPEIAEPFFWGGKNTDASREAGAQQLAERIMQIRQQQPNTLVHLIAHSHGGNVVLRAVEIIFGHLGEEGVEQLFGSVKPLPYFQRVFSTSKSLASRRLASVAECSVKGPAAEFWEQFREGLKQETSTDAQDDLVRLHYPSIPSANPLGRLVFLGTPFLSKAQSPHRERTIVLLWLLTVLSTAWAINLLTAWQGVKGCQAAGIAILVSCFMMALFLDAFQGKLDPLKPFRPDTHPAGNIYHLTKQRWSKPMAAFVVHSGILDEANFALRSAAPLVRAYVVPEVDGYFDLQPWKSLPADIKRAFTLRKTLAGALPRLCPWGSVHRRTAFFSAEIMVYTCLIAVLSFLVRLVFLPFVYFAKRVLIKALQKLLVHVVLGTGSAEKSVSGGKVTVSECLRLEQLEESGPGNGIPSKKSTVVHWNVQRLILDKEDSFGTPSQKEPRFDFLLERAAPAGGSGAASKVAQLRRSPSSSVVGALERAGCFDGLEDAETEELMLIAKMLEERQKEITGQVEVRHSLYYSKEEILEAMVEFLQDGATGHLFETLARFDKCGD